MQGLARLVQAQGRAVTGSVLQHVRISGSAFSSGIQTRQDSGQPSKEGLEEHGFESTTIQDILKEKGQKADGSWLWCSVDDTVYDAVKSVSILISIMHWPISFALWSLLLIMSNNALQYTWGVVSFSGWWHRWLQTMWEHCWLSKQEKRKHLLALSLREVGPLY